MSVTPAESVNISSIQLKEGVAPSNPTAGFARLYLGSDEKLHLITDDPLDRVVGEGGFGVALDTGTELTIASGVITLVEGIHTVDTEADAGTDDLVTINGGVDGALYLLSPADAARTIVIKSGAGNIRTANGNQMTLSGLNDYALIRYKNSTYNVINTLNNPLDLQTWGGAPDGELTIGGQDSAGDFFGINGDEIQRWVNYLVTGDITLDYATYHFIFNDTTDRTITINASTVLDGHRVRARALQVSGGTGHKFLLPASTYWGSTGTNRAAIFNAVDDCVEGVAVDVGGGVTRVLLNQNTSTTFAAS